MPIPHDEAHKWVGPGWHELVKKLVADLEAINPNFNIEQVKEKFGGLRFYGYTTDADHYGWTDEQRELVDQAEEASFSICETCGEPGTPSDDGAYWVKTNCEKHRAERMKAIEERKRAWAKAEAKHASE